MGKESQVDLVEWKKKHDHYMEKGPGKYLPIGWRNCECHKNTPAADPSEPCEDRYPGDGQRYGRC